MNHEFSTPRRTAVALDPHPLCHVALSTLLGRIDIDLVGTATSTDAALTLLQQHRPDLLVLELDLPEGRDAALHLISSGPRDVPDLTTVVLSGIEERRTIDAAFDHGATAYVLKSSDPDTLTTAIQQAFKPSLFLARPRPAADEAGVKANGATEGGSNGHANGSGPELLEKLTRRELEILQLVSGGRSNRQVAQILWVADQTVKFHLANVYRKLGVRSRFEAARWARENGVLDVVVDSGEAISMAEPKTNGNGSSSLVPLRRPSRPNRATGRYGETSR
jgi:two-component system nitrate/nitrite response regulator NarL